MDDLVPTTNPGLDVISSSILFLAIAVTQPHQCIGPYLRLAAAFGAKAVIVIGRSKFSSHGAHGAAKHVPIIHFHEWEECIQLVKELNLQCMGLHLIVTIPVRFTIAAVVAVVVAVEWVEQQLLA